MGKYYWLTLLLAAASCHPASDAEGRYTPAVAGGDAQATSRAETMRLHETLMGHTDSLLSENERLRLLATRLDTHTVAGYRQAIRLRRLCTALLAADAGMLAWRYEFHDIDTVGLSAHQYADFWTHERQGLRRLDSQTRIALDSTRRVR